MKLATASFRSDATSNGGPHPSNSPSNGITSLPGLPVILDPRAPFDIARSFLYRFYRLGSLPTLFSQSGDFYKWSGRHYPEVEESTIRVQLYEYLDEALRPTEDGTRPFKPTKQRIDQVLDALRAAANLDRQQIAPVWLGDVPAPANEILPCRNGLLHLPTGRLFSHTPEFFCHNVLDFDYDADAPLPIQWLEFLNELWPGDDEAISTLQEIFGLCLTGDTRYQKMFLLIGPRRSGKGTIARVLTGLVGRENVVGPNLSSLVKPFGPAALIGKRVACIADARVGRLTNHDELAERLLSITGEDVQTIDRKYRESWTGRLQVRFIILSNEIPQFDERSGALSSRSIVLALTQSFLGRENLRLTDKLFSELSGILNWGIVGFRRLHSRGYFIQPISGEMLASELEDLSSPIKAFVKERCEISFDKRVECRALYREYGRWTFEQHQSIASRVPPINLFSRDLRAAVPGLKVSQPRINGKQTRVYEGVGLR